MNEKNNSCLVEFEFNPLGELIINWKIPLNFINKNTKYYFEIPGFKYDLPKFLSIPVPFSSKSYELNTEIISKTKGLNIEISSTKYGNKNLVIEYEKIENDNEIIQFEYKIPNIINADGIYFIAVYPFRTPFDGQSHDIKINCKFSYNIRIYSFWERYFEYPTNKKLVNKNNLKYSKSGDELRVHGTILGTFNQTIDFHITGTRFPFYIRRDIFWLIVFLITSSVFLSPIIREIINFFKTNNECGESINYYFSILKF